MPSLRGAGTCPTTTCAVSVATLMTALAPNASSLETSVPYVSSTKKLVLKRILTDSSSWRMQPLFSHGTLAFALHLPGYPANSEAALHLLMAEARKLSGEMPHVQTA
jgi:hypothetical protein